MSSNDFDPHAATKQWRIAHGTYGYNRTEYRTLRTEVLNRYGGKCSCCGEQHYEFLSLDHIDGGGNQHRKVTGRGMAQWRWFKRNNYPAGYRVLCANCNTAYAYHGECPHQRAELQNVV